MNKLKKHFAPTKLATKLIKRIALVALASLAVAFALAYAIFWPQLRDDAHDEAVSASRYIMLSINDAVKTLDGYAGYMASSPALAAAVNAPEGAEPDAVNDTLDSLRAVSPNIRAVVLVGQDSGYFQAGQLGQQDWELLWSSWVSDIMRAAAIHNWSGLYVSELDEPEQTLVRMSLCSIGGREYLLSIFYDAGALMDSISALAESTYTGYFLTDRHEGVAGLPFYTVGDVGNGVQIAASYDGAEPYSTRDGKGHYFLTTIPANGWQLVGFIDRVTFNSSLMPFIGLLFLICLILGIFIFLALVPAVNRLLAPLGELGRTMENVSVSGPDFYSQVQTDDEIGRLSDGFNDMLDALRINAQRELEQEKAAQRMSYSLMTAQINSHFFYNTMSTINSLARQGRTEDVVRANTALTSIFQDCLHPQDIRAGDTVARERAVVECYWVIETLDPANEVSLQWDVPEDLTEKRIPKNIIQPLVENALFHGLDDAETGRKRGWIKVSLAEEDGGLVLAVSNNGAPIPPETLEKLNRAEPLPDGGPHIGLSNIRKRLSLLYGDKARLSISSGEETTITIHMPAL